jgi:hypothetical protein
MPTEASGRVELQLNQQPSGPIDGRTIYWLPKSHSAFNENLSLLMAALIPGYYVHLENHESGEISSVAFGQISSRE